MYECLFVRLSVCPSVCMYICPSIRLSVRVSSKDICYPLCLSIPKSPLSLFFFLSFSTYFFALSIGISLSQFVSLSMSRLFVTVSFYYGLSYAFLWGFTLIGIFSAIPIYLTSLMKPLVGYEENQAL
jgi:hypothetical protein